MLDDSLVVIDVGQGSAALLSEGGRTALIDAGPGSAVLEFVTRHGVRRLDLVIISHADKDHVGGVIGLLASEVVEIGSVFLNTDSEKDSTNWETMLRALQDARKKQGIEFHVGISQDTTSALRTAGFSLEVLAPSGYVAAKGPGGIDARGRKLTANSVSVVLSLARKGQTYAILAGDIDDVGLENMLETTTGIASPVLVFPHHGGKPGKGDPYTFAKTLLKEVKPTTVLFSMGRGSFGHPDPDVVRAAREAESNPRIACTQLSQRCAAQTTAVGRHHLSLFAMGQERNMCCGGTFHLDLRMPPGQPVAPADGHRRFVQDEVATPLCLGKGEQ